MDLCEYVPVPPLSTRPKGTLTYDTFASFVLLAHSPAMPSRLALALCRAADVLGEKCTSLARGFWSLTGGFSGLIRRSQLPPARSVSVLHPPQTLTDRASWASSTRCAGARPRTA